MCREVKVIAFDADDTLWENQSHYLAMQEACAALLSEYVTADVFYSQLFMCETRNMSLYGYGAKAFTLSVIEVALACVRELPGRVVEQIIAEGKKLIDCPIVPKEGVRETLALLEGKFDLAVATKGDPIDQLRKLEKSGLSSFFQQTHVMPTKSLLDYEKLVRDLRIAPASFVMVGNCYKSDILPPLELGANAIYIPHPLTWEEGEVDVDAEHPHLTRLERFEQLQYLI